MDKEVFLFCNKCRQGKNLTWIFYCWDCKVKKCPQCSKEKLGVVKILSDEKGLTCSACEKQVKFTFNDICGECIVIDRKLNGCACDLVIDGKVQIVYEKKVCSVCNKEEFPALYCDDCVSHKYGLLEAEMRPAPNKPLWGGRIVFLALAFLVVVTIFAFGFYIWKERK